ncbi:sialic acid TRAP transporter substrate-binding protein SiaP [Algicella marina]|uniref:DctP family TRAP transporter solute-binding subunit n=1 Tax=Algicella marina TaxID=2683284 RepID=A0A6P1SY08_9RHOB|nr:sialic acid TRAP transporter substrate-binding protein SiaP [Algicella marina]QHQ35368.1 DctP family TRAP transporter solute-binding subunit [Algicella marina]
MIARTLRTIVACAAVGAVWVGSVSAADLKWAHVYETDSSYHKWALWAAEEVSTRTEGRVNIEVFPASSLGNESDINEGLTLGSVDIIYTGPNFAERDYGPIAISDYPFMLRDYAHWEAYRDSDLFEELSEGYREATGHSVMAITWYGYRHVTSNFPISKPTDMEGLKIRVPDSPVMVMFPNAVGANPTPIAFAEVYLALQQGVVDAQENPLPTIQFKRFYEVQSNINLTGHIGNSLIIIVSETAMGVTGEDAATLEEVMKEAAAKCADEINQSEQDLVQWFIDEGIQINEVDKAAFQEAVAPIVTDESKVPYTLEMYERLQALGQ